MVSTQVAKSTEYGRQAGAEHKTFQINQQKSKRVNIAPAVQLGDLGRVKLKTFPVYRSFIPIRGGEDFIDQVYLIGKSEEGGSVKFNFTGSAQSSSATGIMNKERLSGATREDGKPLWVELPVENWPKEYLQDVQENGEKPEDHIYAVRTAPINPSRFELFLGKEAGENGREMAWKVAIKGDRVLDAEVAEMFDMDFSGLV